MAVALTETPKHEDDLLACQNRRLWQAMWAGWAVAGVLAVVVAALIERPPPPPYVFVTNMKGEPLAKLQPVLSARAVPEPVVKWELSEYLTAAFAVSPMWDEEQERLGTLKAMTTGQAVTALTSWYKAGNDPLQVGRSAWQDVHDVRVLKGSAASEYVATWMTTRHALNDGATTTTRWRATLGVTAVKASVNNELGIGVQSLDFSQE